MPVDLPLTLALLLALLLMLAVARLRRRVRELRAEAELARRSLAEAIEALPASVEIYGPDDQLIAYNRRLVELYPHMEADFARHQSFEAMVRASLERGGVPEAVGREAEWLAERLAQRGRQPQPLLQRVHDDRWLRIHERRTPSGGMVAVRMDVSDLVHEQQRLAASQAHLQALIQAAMNGILTLDAQGHVLDANPACEQLFGHAADALRGSHLGLLVRGLPPGPLQPGSTERTALVAATQRIGRMAEQLLAGRVGAPSLFEF